MFRPTPLKNHGVSSSVGAGFSIPNWMESHEIPWFQSPPTSGTWPKFLGSTTMYIVSLSLGENPFLNSDDIARLNVGWKIHLFPTFDTGEYWEYHDNSPYILHFGWSSLLTQKIPFLVAGAISPSWKMMEFVNGKDDIPSHIMKWKIKHVWNHQPASLFSLKAQFPDPRARSSSFSVSQRWIGSSWAKFGTASRVSRVWGNYVRSHQTATSKIRIISVWFPINFHLRCHGEIVVTRRGQKKTHDQRIPSKKRVFFQIFHWLDYQRVPSGYLTVRHGKSTHFQER